MTPTPILQLRGSKRAAQRSGEIEPTKGSPSVPPGFDKEHRALWRRLCRMLRDMNLLTVVDGPQLERYCRMYVLWRRVQEVLNNFDSAAKLMIGWRGDETRPIIRNALTEARNLDTHLKQIENNFGLSPAARARLACLMNGHEGETARDDREARFFEGIAS